VRRAIGVVAHESLCYGDLTGRENLALYARLYGVADPSPRVDEMLTRVGLDSAADRAARTYSRGMLQRLSVGRALCHRPGLLLLDEPFSGLDRAGCERLAELLAEEKARGVAVIVATHDFEAMAPVTDRVVVLARGKVAHDAPAPSGCTATALADIYRRVTTA
jgi:heme exporter protein A